MVIIRVLLNKIDEMIEFKSSSEARCTNFGRSGALIDVQHGQIYAGIMIDARSYLLFY